MENLDLMKATCRFDNSADNPKNPSNPLKDVRWGEGTEDERVWPSLASRSTTKV